MPQTKIDRQTIERRAYELAMSEGIANVTAREVASACGVSVGSVYNHFPSMDDLHAAVIRRFFVEEFRDDFCHPVQGEPYVDYCRRLFGRMQEVLSKFREEWLAQIHALAASAQERGKELEAQCLGHVERGLATVLARDERAATDELGEGVGVEQVAGFTLRAMLAELREHSDGKALFAILERALYR